MAVVVHELTGCEGFRVEAPPGLLGWVEEPWLGAGGEPAALAVRMIDGRDGLLLREDVESVVREHELVVMRGEARLLELDAPRLDPASQNGLTASWRTTGETLDPPEPPGAVDRALLAVPSVAPRSSTGCRRRATALASAHSALHRPDAHRRPHHGLRVPGCAPRGVSPAAAT